MTLEQRIEQLEDRVLALEEALGIRWIAPEAWRLSPMQERILGVLVKAHVAPTERLMVALYSHSPDPPLGNVLASQICKMRPKLRDHGIEIHSRKGYGYWIEPKVRERLNA